MQLDAAARLLGVIEPRTQIPLQSAAFEQYKAQGGISLGDLKRKLRID